MRFLIHRVELKGGCDIVYGEYVWGVSNSPCGVESALQTDLMGTRGTFLIHRVELKEKHISIIIRYLKRF